MKRLFELVIGQTDEGTYFVAMTSKTDGSRASFQSKSVDAVMVHTRKLINKKVKEMKNFPLPNEPRSNIIYPGANGASKVIVPPGFIRKS